MKPIWPTSCLPIGETVKLVLAGVLGGIVLAFAVQRLAASLLYGVTLGNPGVVFLSIVVLLCAALAAAVIPTWRATHINPTEALRSE